MTDDDFERHRPHLRAVAYRMLGSLADAEDVIQETWLRYQRTDTSGVENLGGWLTTVAGRVCLNLLRSRTTRGEVPLDESDPAVRLPDPVVSPLSGPDPEQEALLADSVGLALQVVLDTLSPAERLAFVLHDLFAVPFDDIAPLVERSPAATRQLASRGRRRVQEAAPTPDADLARQRAAVDAFYAAARDGDFDALVTVLDPDVVLRADGGTHPARPTVLLRGAKTVAGQATLARRLAEHVRPALVNGAAGAVAVIGGRVFAVMAFTVVDGRIAAIDILNDPDRLGGIEPDAFDA
ncbi:sigma-70 family RNA polymerase sigma factor [Jiangella rhizosphaerae]|uniref:Sigma-70 family RNA polymerase sigma factor n=1 Tax=Jiangella rhizosphaerae TaxID=2293569 RepID=A0A418KYP4_9ACTN|nr:sigma-70 family RNA polymerase sigma factor [Jiangella rhizosphaerae]RIQ37413.1 sigma-70 family RNA polymerase sigma factor [Jiangella rhizosphaerae]